MEEVIQKNAGAFEEIYDRYAEPIMNYFFRMIQHDREKAEDFTHDLFTKIVQKPELFDPSRPFKTWLYSVANNMCKNEYKKLAVRKNVTSGIDGSMNVSNEDRSAAIQTDENTFKEELKEALEELEDKHREVFVLRYFDELSVKEIADAVGVKEGTVKSRIYNATKKLSKELAHFQAVLK